MKKIQCAVAFLICCLLCCEVTACKKNNQSNTETVEYTFSINRNEIVLDAGEEFTLIAVYGDKAVSFVSGNTAVVTVDGNGKIKAVAAGETFVTVKADGAEASCKITVFEPAYELSLSKSGEITVAKDAVIEIVATLTRDGVKKDTVIAWSVTNESGCTLDVNGDTAAFSGSAAGEYVITATCDKGECAVTITVLDL